MCICVYADPGQTFNTSETLDRLSASDPQLLLLLGDFAYADNWVNNTHQVPFELWGTLTCEHGVEGLRGQGVEGFG
jgi:hypothetical protein